MDTRASNRVTAAQDKVTSTSKALDDATKAVNNAESALSNIDIIGFDETAKFTKANGEVVPNGTKFYNGSTIQGDTLAEIFKNAENSNTLKNSQDELLRITGVQMAQNFIRNSVIQKDISPVNIDHLTDNQMIEVSQLYAAYMNKLRHALGQNTDLDPTTVTDISIQIAKNRAKAKYVELVLILLDIYLMY